MVWSRSEVVWALFLALKATLSTLHPLLWGPAVALNEKKPKVFDFAGGGGGGGRITFLHFGPC